ncbi:hypothetical protein BW41_01697 [Sphingomonas sp. RIT328]|nr:hypothetical protein BW41_01697 [Sphingomonas sp. RIT328]
MISVPKELGFNYAIAGTNESWSDDENRACTLPSCAAAGTSFYHRLEMVAATMRPNALE